MKKTYLKPDMRVVEMKAKKQILAGSGGIYDNDRKKLGGMYWDQSADDNEEGL